MQLRFHLDPETGQPHIWDHGVTEDEVRQVMAGGGDDFRGDRKSRVRFGRTWGGRYLKVFYVPDEEGDGAFVVTAYELKAKELKAYRRRQRRKGK
jgi:hypothetical protein